jgi:hypothetical protein
VVDEGRLIPQSTYSCPDAQAGRTRTGCNQRDVAAAGRSSQGGSFLNAVATAVGQAATGAAGLGTLIAYIPVRYMSTYIPTCSAHSNTYSRKGSLAKLRNLLRHVF